MSPVWLRVILLDPEISYQLYKNSKRHGVSVTSAIGLTRAKKAGEGKSPPFLARGPARAAALAALKKRPKFPVSRVLPSGSDWIPIGACLPSGSV